SSYGYLNAAFCYTALGRFEEAKAIAQTALQRTNGAPLFHGALAMTAAAQGDAAAVEKETQLAAADPADSAAWVIPLQAVRAAGHGQFRKAEQILSQAEEISRREGLPESRALAICKRAHYAALVGGKNHEKVDLAGALAIEQGSRINP